MTKALWTEVFTTVRDSILDFEVVDISVNNGKANGLAFSQRLPISYSADARCKPCAIEGNVVVPVLPTINPLPLNLFLKIVIVFWEKISRKQGREAASRERGERESRDYLLHKVESIPSTKAPVKAGVKNGWN